MNLKKRFKYFVASFLMIANTIAPLGNGLVRSAYADEIGEPTTTPTHSKTLKDNGDGTYTINLSVTGETSSDQTSEVTKANVVLVVDTSSSMVNNRPDGNGTPTRLALEQEVLTKDNGIIDNLLRQNVVGDPVKSDIIEVSIVDFGNKGKVSQSWTTDGVTLKNTINSLTTTSGTNWEEGLRYAKTQADDIKSRQPGEDVYVIFMTDGEPTTHYESYDVNWRNIDPEWSAARDDARDIVVAGYKFYSLFTWGNPDRERYLYSLVQYACTGDNTVTSSTNLDSVYAQYYTNATDTNALINALTQIVNDITTNVGYTGVEMTDGVTSMTASGVKANTSGGIKGIKYYRSGDPYSTTANDGLGDEWVDAPKATINDKGEIDWDLGGLVLEDGVTYTISFVVWPKQASLDLVAELNNGVVKFEDLTEEQKSQIAKSGDSYTLKTNTDFPTLTYQTVTTTTVNGQATTVTSKRKTIDITNPEPVGLYSEEILLQKLWEDSLDPSQREDEVDNVYLQLYKDGIEYDKFHENYDEAHGGIKVEKVPNSNTWTSGEIAIAPGLMVSEGHPAYTEDAEYGVVTMNGKKYAVLNPGHDYVFGESDINNHFELTNYTYHPMLVDGGLMNITFTKSGNTFTGVESAKPMSTISATNTIKGGINIEKKVVDKNGNEITDTQDKFNVKVHLQNPDGSDYSYDYRIYYGQNNPEYENCSDKTNCRSEHKYGDGVIDEQIYVGDVIRVVNVNTGTLYYVEESNIPAGYSLKEADYAISYGTNAAKDDVAEKTEGNTNWYAVKGNSASTATIVNTYVSGNLKLSKNVTVESGNADTAKAKTFNFTVKLYTDRNKTTELTGSYKIENSEKTVKSGDTVSLKDGESLTILDLPVGAYYEITESDAAGYVATKSGDTGIIADGETTEAKFTNTYNVSGKVTIKAKKDFNDWQAGESFLFKLNGDGLEKEMSASVRKGEAAEFEVEIKNIGTYNYTISEDLTNLRGGVTKTSGDISVTVVATDNGDGTLSFTTAYAGGEGEEKDTIVNQYRASGKIRLGASKILTGRDWQQGELYTFTVFDNEGNELRSRTDIGADGKYEFDEITYKTEDAGKTFVYVIRETSALPGGVTNSGDITATVTVTDNHDGTLKTTVVYTGGQGEEYNTIVNTYSATGEYVFEIEKELTGRDWQKGENYSFALRDATGATLDTQTISSNGKISFKALKFTQADAGEHKYVISETGNLPSGMSNSGDVEVTLNVTDDKAGKLGFEASYTKGAKIINTYDASGEVALEATKVLDGRDWRDGESFEFELSGDGIDAQKIVVTEEKPTAKFDKISYDESDAGKTYTYTIKETTDLTGMGMSYSGDITVTVELTDDGEGNIVPKVTYSKEDKIIKNTYSAKGEVVLSAEKKLEGRDWQNGESFELALKNEDGSVIDTQTVTADGVVNFKKIDYTKAGTYKYTIEETTTLPGGMSNSGKINVSVVVTDNYDGTLAVKATYEQDNQTIVNTYVAKGEVVLEAEKKLEGRDWQDGESFTFELFEGETSLGQRTVTKDNLKAVFDKITYTEADIDAEYVYTIKEVSTLPAGVTKSGDLTVYVDVYDNGDGTLRIETDYVDGYIITNTYKAKPAVIDVPFTVKKVIEDQSNSKKDASFTFELRNDEDEVAQSKEITTEDLTGTVDFDTLSFEEAGTYKYTLTEVNDGQAGFEYDTTEYEIVVVVTDDYEKAQLEAKLTIDGEEIDEAVFTNIYKAEEVIYGCPECEVPIEAKKVFENRDLKDGEFEFEVYLDDELVATGHNMADGTIVLNEGIVLDKVGTYDFIIKEKVEEREEYVIYDENEYAFTVEVADNDEGALEIVSDTSGEVVFTNKYDKPGKGGNVTPKPPVTNDSILSSVAMFAVSLIGAIGGVLFAKKSLKEEA